jgi:hypothetical protein
MKATLNQDNLWILDSFYYTYANALLQESQLAFQKKLLIENKLNQYIIDIIYPFLDEYHELSANTSDNPKISNTKQIIAKDWLLDKIKAHILLPKS